MSVRILQGDCRDLLRALPDRSVHCCVTSPPYFGLREYGTARWEGGSPDCDHVVGELRRGAGMEDLGAKYRGGGHKAAKVGKLLAKGECPKCGAVRVDRQIGQEPTLDAYITEMVAVFREVRRVLRNDGVLFFNLGDVYASGNSGPSGVKPKDLLMVPARVALALQADGWWLRSEIVWVKPNPMPESVTDRPTSAHEKIFLFSKADRYFYDAEAVREESITGDPRRPYTSKGARDLDGRDEWHGGEARADGDFSKRNLRNVWTIPVVPFLGAHFATFPPQLPDRCIKAGTSERGCCPACGAPWVRIVTKGAPDEAHRAACGADASGGYRGRSKKGHAAAGVQDASAVKARILAGMRERHSTWEPSCSCPPADPVPCTVLDPFGGAGTTGLVADRLGRDALLLELNPEYAAMAEDRLKKDGGMFADVAARKSGIPSIGIDSRYPDITLRN